MFLESQLQNSVYNDSWMLSVLYIVRNLNLPACWIGAGFIRNKIWDLQHAYTATPLNDIDVIYFDKNVLDKNRDVTIENSLKEKSSDINWSVKNQARMHLKNKHLAYKNCYEAICFWPETATAIAIRLNEKDKIEILAPYGLEDLFNLIVKPTPYFNKDIYKERIKIKKWEQRWKKLDIFIP